MRRKPPSMAPKDLVNICAILLIVFTGVTFYQRLTMERSLARKSSAHFEQAYNKAQDEVAEWRRKYNGEIARAQECNANMTKKLQQTTEELSVASAQLVSAQADNQKLLIEIIKLNADRNGARERHVDVGVDMRKLEELSQLPVRDRRL